MRIQIFEDPSEFIANSEPCLLKNEATHNLVISFAYMLVQNPGLAHNFFSCLRDSNDVVVGAALWVPGRKMVATSCPTEAIPLLTDALLKTPGNAQERLTGLYAPELTASSFSSVWSQVSSQNFHKGLEQVVMELRFSGPPIKPAQPPGRFRRAWLEDLRLLREWAQAMAEETKIDEPREETAELVRRMIEARRLFVWDNGGPVAMGGFSGNTPNGARINSVYVPEKFRRKGYARACTWSIGEFLRQSRKSFACLFADKYNPASIALYQGLGYEIVGDISDYRIKP